jgi:catechol 2,3-dioxygenase-like lactoylglutathione lyase family enzyme
MTKADPIIAVKDVEASTSWYQQVFGFRNLHGGKHFATLAAEDDAIVLCLHQWGEHAHPTMMNPGITPSNGLLLYFRTDNINNIHQNIQKMGWPIEEDLHLNPNSTKKEFSFRDPDGYYLTVSEFHQYNG